MIMECVHFSTVLKAVKGKLSGACLSDVENNFKVKAEEKRSH